MIPSRRSTRLFLALSLASAPAFAADAPAKKWSETAQLSFLSANGNAKSSTLGANEAFKYDGASAGVELNGSALGSSQKGAVNAEQYDASEKVSRKLSDRNYAFERVAWGKNRFAGVANRVDTSAGLGRELIKTSADLLAADLGGGYVFEQRLRDPRDNHASGRAYAKYTRTLSPTATFSQDAEYLHDFKDSTAYRLNAQTALTASLTTHASLKASFDWKKVNVPPPGFAKNDTLTSIAVIFNY